MDIEIEVLPGGNMILRPLSDAGGQWLARFTPMPDEPGAAFFTRGADVDGLLAADGLAWRFKDDAMTLEGVPPERRGFW